MDDADRAQPFIDRERAAAVENRAMAEAVRPYFIDGRICCRDCLQPIPNDRLEAQRNAGRCAPCQTLYEIQQQRQA